MKLAFVDLDGVVADHWGGINRLRAKLGLSYLPLWHNWNLEGMDPDDAAWVERAFADPYFFEKLLPVSGALPALHILNEFYDIMYITSRGMKYPNYYLNFQSASIRWLEAMDIGFGFLVQEHSKDKGAAAHRVSHIADQDIAFAVDDSPDAILGYMDSGIRTFRIRQPYNEHVKHREGYNLYSVHSLLDVVEEMNQLDNLGLPERVKDLNWDVEG